jgi:hypothetical protein
LPHASLKSNPSRLVEPADLLLRRRIDTQVLQVRKAIHDRLVEKARQAMPEGAADAADGMADADA